MQNYTCPFLKIIGVVLTLVGLVAAYYGPLEIFVFYFFSEGGRFYYAGFGMGSFWFAALVVQNIGYYVIAALCLPVGLGHLKLRRWALTLTQLYLWFWLGAGTLLTGKLILLIPSALRLDLDRSVLFVRMGLVGVFSFLFLILLPTLALWFYKSERVRLVFQAHDPNRYWTERYPSVYVVSFCILVLSLLIYGTVRLKGWAWWGSLVGLSLLSVSSALSFSRHSFYDIILMLDLPPYEMDFLDEWVLIHDYHPVGLLAAPLLIALGLTVYSRRYFGKRDIPGESVAS